LSINRFKNKKGLMPEGTNHNIAECDVYYITNQFEPSLISETAANGDSRVTAASPSSVSDPAPAITTLLEAEIFLNLTIFPLRPEEDGSVIVISPL
jgi:hypothetical protein